MTDRFAYDDQGHVQQCGRDGEGCCANEAAALIRELRAEVYRLTPPPIHEADEPMSVAEDRVAWFEANAPGTSGHITAITDLDRLRAASP